MWGSSFRLSTLGGSPALCSPKNICSNAPGFGRNFQCESQFGIHLTNQGPCSDCIFGIHKKPLFYASSLMHLKTLKTADILVFCQSGSHLEDQNKSHSVSTSLWISLCVPFSIWSAYSVYSKFSVFHNFSFLWFGQLRLLWFWHYFNFCSYCLLPCHSSSQMKIERGSDFQVEPFMSIGHWSLLVIGHWVRMYLS